MPDAWVERLFQRMEDRYGDLWSSRYGAFPRDRVKRSWGEDLADLSGDELARGVEACRSAKFPPTLPEFRELCRPPTDFEAAFVEAVQQMSERDLGRDRWSAPAIFWAAVTIGNFDLRNGSWSSMEKRWRKVLQAELDKGEWPAIPVRAIALPAPEPTERERQAAARILAAVPVRGVGDQAWAGNIEKRAQEGKPVARIAMEWAGGVLGHRLLRGGEHAHRPDAKDLQAGDLHEHLEEQVAI